MIQVSLDTSFLISFADPTRPHHEAAVNYFKYCVNSGIAMFVSTVVSGEFHLGQPFSDLPLQNLRIQPYNLPHALRAAELLKFYNSQNSSPRTESRRVIINDIKILAQAAEDKVAIVLSEDEGTLAKLASRARASRNRYSEGDSAE